MSDGLYEILALAARYFFAGIFLLIVLRAWRITVRDGRRARKLRRLSPETGLAGELVVIEGDGKARRGMRYPVIREGVIGSGRFADVRVRHASILKSHARFELKADGLHVRSDKAAPLFAANGQRARALVARDGEQFRLGRIRLLLVLSEAGAASLGGGEPEGDEWFLAPALRPEESRKGDSDPDRALYGPPPRSRENRGEGAEAPFEPSADELFSPNDEPFSSDDEDFA